MLILILLMTYVDIICKNYITHAHRPYVLSNGMMTVVYFLGKTCFITSSVVDGLHLSSERTYYNQMERKS